MPYHPIKRDPNKAEFVSRITRAFLTKHRLTLAQASEAAGVGYSRQAFGFYAQGQRVPPEKVLHAALEQGGPIAEEWAAPIIAYSLGEGVGND